MDLIGFWNGLDEFQHLAIGIGAGALAGIFFMVVIWRLDQRRARQAQQLHLRTKDDLEGPPTWDERALIPPTGRPYTWAEYQRDIHASVDLEEIVQRCCDAGGAPKDPCRELLGLLDRWERDRELIFADVCKARM